MTKSSMAGKLLIGTIGIAVAVATTAITGGMSLGWAAATVGAEVFTEVAIGAVVGGTIYAATHKPDEFKIEDCLAEMGDGFLYGYAIGGAVSGAKGVFSLAKSWVKTGETTAKYTEVVSEGGRDLDIPDTKPSINQGKEPFRNANLKKTDIKMVNDAVNQIGVDRKEFGNYIHEIKADLGMKANQNFTYQELLELAKEYKKLIE